MDLTPFCCDPFLLAWDGFLERSSYVSICGNARHLGCSQANGLLKNVFEATRRDAARTDIRITEADFEQSAKNN